MDLPSAASIRWMGAARRFPQSRRSGAEKSRPNDPSGWPRLGLAPYGNGPPIIRGLGKSQAIHGFNPSGLRFLLTSFLRSGRSF